MRRILNLVKSGSEAVAYFAFLGQMPQEYDIIIWLNIVFA